MTLKTEQELEWKPIEPSQDELDFMEHQKYILAKRFKISRQEVGFALSGTIVESTICPDGVREITDFRVYSVSLVPLEQVPFAAMRVYMAKYPTWPEETVSQTEQTSI